MLSLLTTLTLAQASVSAPPPNSLPSPQPKPSPQKIVPPSEQLPPQGSFGEQESLQPFEIFRPQEVRPLPGKLDEVPVFNSNSPEVVQTEGILLSTFPPVGKNYPLAHLNYPFQGRFDIFTHHISRARTQSELRSLFQGLLVYNPTLEPIRLEILQGASYLTRPDALFINLPPYKEDPLGTVYSGPGSRVVNDILRGRRQGLWSPLIEIPPGNARMLMNLPIPAGTVTPTSNGRSTLLRLWSSGPIYIANLAMYAPLNGGNTERPPTLEEWANLLVRGNLAGPRDIPPTPIEQLSSYSRITYGRVAGVSIGSQWQANVTDNPKVDYLTIPQPGKAFSYGLSTLYRGTFGTTQIQSARLAVRYPDTAYQANGNYGTQYSLTMPLFNPTKQVQKVSVLFQTPLKDDFRAGGLLFAKPLEDRVFFRGPLRIRYTDDRGLPQTRYMHLVQMRGQEGEPLLTLSLPPNARRLVQLDFLYPPDATPPQVITIKTIEPTK